MIADQLHELLDAAPFHPFTVSQSDGKSVTIDHPDFAMFSRSGQTLMVNVEGDRWVWLNLPQITRIEGVSYEAA